MERLARLHAEPECQVSIRAPFNNVAEITHECCSHLALHVVSGDLVSEHMKNKRHYNEFNPKNGYFIRLKHVLEWFEADAPGWWEMVRTCITVSVDTRDLPAAYR